MIGTLVSAFIEDPVERWLWPEPQEYLTQFPAFVAAFGGEAFARQTVWTLGGFAAAALWIPPGFDPDVETIIAVLRQSVSPEQHEDTFSVLEQMDDAHPTYPHWYLPWLGVDGPRKGAGLGGELLRDGPRTGWDDGYPAFMRRVLDSDQARAIYRKRQATVEPVFGQIKHGRGIDRSKAEADRPSDRNGGSQPRHTTC